MIRQTLTAGRQIDELLDHYFAKRRDEAVENLRLAVRAALESIDSDPSRGQPFPSPYPSVRQYGFSWIKVHRYWFGYSIHKGYPVLTNVLFETADIPGRVADEDEEIPIVQ